MKRKALGKGLSALLPDPESTRRPESVLEVPMESLEPNPRQPRLAIDATRLQELVASIRESGMVQPILVRPHAGRFQIVAGERRWRAAQQLGLSSVPVTVRDVADDRVLEYALIENIQREDLSPLEEAQAYQRLQEELRLTQDELAQKVGKDRSTVANALRLLKLPRLVRELLGQGLISAGHARALLALEPADHLVALAQEAARKGWSVREVERRVGLRRQPRRAPSRKDPNTRAAEERLRAALGTRVQISRRGKGGLVRIAFKNETELNRIYDHIVRTSRGRGN